MEQERIQKQSTAQKREAEAAHILQDGEEQVTQVAAGIRASNAALDNILADYVPPEGPTEIIGATAPVKRPQLRQVSSEEFIRAFRQQPGQ